MGVLALLITSLQPHQKVSLIPAGYDLALRKFLTFIYLSGCAMVVGPLVRYSEERATAIKQLFETMAWLPSW